MLKINKKPSIGLNKRTVYKIKQPYSIIKIEWFRQLLIGIVFAFLMGIIHNGSELIAQSESEPLEMFLSASLFLGLFVAYPLLLLVPTSSLFGVMGLSKKGTFYGGWMVGGSAILYFTLYMSIRHVVEKQPEIGWGILFFIALSPISTLIGAVLGGVLGSVIETAKSDIANIRKDVIDLRNK